MSDENMVTFEISVPPADNKAVDHIIKNLGGRLKTYIPDDRVQEVSVYIPKTNAIKFYNAIVSLGLVRDWQ